MPLPAWGMGLPSFSVAVDDEVMLLDERTYAAVPRAAEVRRRLPPTLNDAVSLTRPGATLLLRTAVHPDATAAIADLAQLRGRLTAALSAEHLRAAVTGAHPFQRGAPLTCTLRVRVIVPDADAAMRTLGRLRSHLPLLLALSANSPFLLGRDTGQASVRHAVVAAGDLPRRSLDLAHFQQQHRPTWAAGVDVALGSIDIAITDGQSRLREAGAIAALVQVLVWLLATGRALPALPLEGDEALDEDLRDAARAGMGAHLVDPRTGTRRAARDVLGDLLAACAPAAARLGVEPLLDAVAELAAFPGAARQRTLAGGAAGGPPERQRLARLLQVLADEFPLSAAPRTPPVHGGPDARRGAP